MHRRGPDRRWSDWRAIPYGRYFNQSYFTIVVGYFGNYYYPWSYTGWHRPYRDYRVGYPLPYNTYWEEVPYDLYYDLPPPPYGCDYVMVGRDILLISLSSRVVIDAFVYRYY